MPEVEKRPRTELRVVVRGKRKTERVIALLRDHGLEAEIVENDDDELVNIFETEWYKKTRAEMTPGDVLRIRRENAGLSQAALGEKIGSNRQNISAMERGRREIGRATAEKLAAALGQKPEEFQRRW
ncbi:MAG: helix-turn-helix domain-containing protein [Desulfobulbus sp.]|nr:helix-turn-helix domain-containing protein [Desulfobulbus sp.]